MSKSVQVDGANHVVLLWSASEDYHTLKDASLISFRVCCTQGSTAEKPSNSASDEEEDGFVPSIPKYTQSMLDHAATNIVYALASDGETGFIIPKTNIIDFVLKHSDKIWTTTGAAEDYHILRRYFELQHRLYFPNNHPLKQ